VHTSTISLIRFVTNEPAEKKRFAAARRSRLGGWAWYIRIVLSFLPKGLETPAAASSYLAVAFLLERTPDLATIAATRPNSG